MDHNLKRFFVSLTIVFPPLCSFPFTLLLLWSQSTTATVSWENRRFASYQFTLGKHHPFLFYGPFIDLLYLMKWSRQAMTKSGMTVNCTFRCREWMFCCFDPSIGTRDTFFLFKFRGCLNYSFWECLGLFFPAVRFEPGTAGYKARTTLPLCYTVPPPPRLEMRRSATKYTLKYFSGLLSGPNQKKRSKRSCFAFSEACFYNRRFS